MTVRTILIANRGEIAIRIARAAHDMGLACVTIYSEDDSTSLHRLAADRTAPLSGSGAAAYLDSAQIITIAKREGCDAIHPGYGFLSENAAFARACEKANLTFIGPAPETLELFGDKSKARNLAAAAGVPVLPGLERPASLEEAKAFYASLGVNAAMVIKAVAGGGGRGLRIVTRPEEIDSAYARCVSEARSSFGNGAVLVEQFLPQARHVEVQILGDGKAVTHLWERDCTLQRRAQKLIEIAPAPGLDADVRQAVLNSALLLAKRARYRGLGTMEFLVTSGPCPQHYFMEANPRLQVEHTITEEVTGVDLVKTQIAIAGGTRLADLGLTHPDHHKPHGYALQARVNMEAMDAKGRILPSGGVLHRFDPPTGPGVRIDSYGYTGYRTNPGFDSLLAKVIVHSPSPEFPNVLRRADRALSEFRVAGVSLNIGLLRALLHRPEVAGYNVHTRFVEAELASLAPEAADIVSRQPVLDTPSCDSAATAAPLTVPAPSDAAALSAPAGTIPLKSPMLGAVLTVYVTEGDAIAIGQDLALLESMKMEHVITAVHSGIIRKVCIKPGDVIILDQPIAFLEEADTAPLTTATEVAAATDDIRPDLAAYLERLATTQDENRPEAVTRRHQRGQRTARENIFDLCDPGSFTEYGALALAGQRQRRSEEELIRLSPADGLITGIGSINGDLFGPNQTRTVVLAYDPTVFAGTQGAVNHLKTDRMIDLAEESGLPLVLFAEGGGGRPGETDYPHVGGLYIPTFEKFAALSGKVPLVGLAAGRCFAGNAALLGGCDVIIATQNSNIGMGGPAMIEGGGLGVVRPEDIGPAEIQSAIGLVDIIVADEAEGVAKAKQYLSYLQGALTTWEAADQRFLRHAIPENRLRSYVIRDIITLLVDKGTFLELRANFGRGLVTGFARAGGRPFGLMASNPQCLGGAIDAEAARKAADFITLCDSYNLPVLSLADTPGFMVGPAEEEKGMVEQAAALFKASARARIPLFFLALRKCYGLGSMSLMGGHTRAPFSCVSWPSAEFGGMGLEGHVRLGYRQELDAIADDAKRQARFRELVAELYDKGKAINTAAYFEIDGVIDPADTRTWLLQCLASVGTNQRYN